MYSCTSLNTGLDGERQLPQAQETPALADLFQIISPRIKYPISSIVCISMAFRGK